MRSMRMSLIVRCLGIALLAVAVGTALLTASNIFIYGNELAALLAFNIPAIMAGNLVVVAMLLVFAYRWIGRPEDKEDAQRRLAALPNRMFAGTLAVSAVLSLLYHAAEAAFYDAALTRPAAFFTANLPNLTGEMTVALVIGTLILALCRRAVRPHLVSLNAESRAPGRPAGFATPLAMAAVSCFFIVSSAGVIFAMQPDEGRTGPSDLAVVLAVRALFCLIVFALLVFEVRKDVGMVLERIRALLKEDAAAMRRQIPVVAQDELGELTESFNLLQRHMRSASENMLKELQLAYQVQTRLLPAASLTAAGLGLEAVTEACRQVGGDLFGVEPRGADECVVMIGDVSGNGMPAAMIMTAALALFRKEARSGASPAAILERLNASFAEALQGRMYVTMGVGVWNARRAELTYASAGHLAPFLLRRGQAIEFEVPGAFPLGIDAEQRYREVCVPLREGDGVMLFTDGVVETEWNGGFLGFEGLADLAGKLPGDEPAAASLRRLMERFSADRRGAPEDDRTIVLFRVSGERENALEDL